jgi:hypothetical protein
MRFAGEHQDPDPDGYIDFNGQRIRAVGQPRRVSRLEAIGAAEEAVQNQPRLEDTSHVEQQLERGPPLEVFGFVQGSAAEQIGTPSPILQALAQQRPSARPALITSTEAHLCQYLQAARAIWDRQQQKEGAKRQLREQLGLSEEQLGSAEVQERIEQCIKPDCSWCGLGTYNWCELPPPKGAHRRAGAAKFNCGKAVCIGCEQISGGCRRCKSESSK